MLSFIKKKNYLLFLLSLIIFFSIHAIFQVFPEVRLGSRVLAIDSNGCEGGWTFNGGDAGDDSNWEYTGCEEDSGGGDDSDDDRDKWWEDDEDSDNTNYCDEDTWSNEETDGSYWCDNGRICFEQWGRDESCNIYRDGEDCREDARCKQDQNNEESNNQCKYTYKYPECQADGQVYEVWQDCNGNWDPRPTGKSCSENEDQEDQQENQGSCAANEYWDTQSGKCVVNDLEQTKINDDIYCREQCNNSCSGGLGHMRCTQPDGSFTYDCNDPQNQANIAECQNVLEEEFAHVGIDPVGSGGIGAGDLASQSPVCGYADLDSGECRGSQYCKTHILYCDGQIAGQPEIGGNCNLVPGLCGVKADDTGNLYVDRPACNPECGSDERCMDDGNGAGFCQANSINQPPVTVIDSQNNIRVEGTTLRIGEGAAGVSDCQNITSDQEKHNCLVEYAKSHIGDFTGQTVAPQPSPQSDTTCQTQTPSENYCDGNVCIEKSSGWDGSACVPVYRSVSNSNCNNACGGNSAQSGEAVNLLNCLEANDDKSRADCKAENNRIIQTGQQIDPTSRIKASLSLENCSNFQDEAKQACENKNEETKFLGKVLDSIRLEDCASKNGDEKSACETQNLQTIRQGQVRLNLGVEDCSKLSGDQKINCEFTNYQRDQLAKISASFRPENCSEIKNEQEAERCNSENQRRYHDAISNASDFVGLAELGASCVYTEACQEGGKKACAGTVANDNGAPVCRYDPAAASCSACTTADLNLQNTENKCSEDGQTCLNGPGLACISDAQCQNRLAAAQQAAANAPVDPAKFFSQKFEEGATCLQPQTCDLGDGTQGEQVCYGKGSAEGKCDLSQGGGVCSACQAKGSIKLNREASCNAENKCVGAPALSGCMNDDQCKPVEVVTQRIGTVTNSVGAGQTVINNQIFDIEKVCTTERRRVNDYMNYQDAAAASGDEAFALQQSQNVSNSYEDYVVCAEKYTPTGRQAVATVVYYDRAVIQATNATNQLDSTHLGSSALSGGTDDIMVSQVNASYLAKLEEQRRVLENLKQAESALAQIGYNSQLSTILDRSTDVQLNEGVRQQIAIEDQTLKAQQSLAAVAAARNSFNQNSIGNSADSETVVQTYDEFEKAREKAQSEISQLAALRRESSTGLSQQLQNQLDNLPTKADQQFKETQLQRESNQLANVARTSTSPDVVLSTEVAIARRADEADALGNKTLADALAQQANQAGFSGWTNIYTNQLLQPGGDSEKANTNEAQQQIQRVIEQTQKTNPQLAQQLKNEYEAIPSYVTAIRLANEIKRETVGTFAGTVNQDNNSAFYSAIANAEEQAKSREDLANLVDRTCTLSAQRCTTLQNALGITNPNATPDQIADSVIGTSQSDGARAANLLVEQSRLLPQLYQVERAGDANNTDQLTSLLGRSNQIKAELAQIDPNLAVRAQAQVQEVIAQGKAQNQLDYAANTYANNKDLLVSFEKARSNSFGTLPNGLDPVAEISAAQSRMQGAIEQMSEVNPEKAKLMQQDFDLTTFKIESSPQGSEFVSKGCIVESCSGNGVKAQNICSGNVSSGKNFDAFCAAQNGNTDPKTAWETYLEANQKAALEPPVNNKTWGDIAANTWEVAKSIPQGIPEIASNWFQREIESKTPVFLGSVEQQKYCRENTTIIPFMGGAIPTGCQIDNRSQEERNQIAAAAIQNGKTMSEALIEVSGEKAASPINQTTLKQIAEETGVDLSVPVIYWTNTQRNMFAKKLEGYYGGGFTDVFDSVVFPTTAYSEANEAARRCQEEWGKNVCGLDVDNASTYVGLVGGDVNTYQTAVNQARAFFPNVEAVSQEQLGWVTSQINGAQSANRVNILEPGATISRDQFETEEEYLNALNLSLSTATNSILTRAQLIDEMTLANARGEGPNGKSMTRDEIEKAVDTYLALGYYGENVVAKSDAYAWRKSTENEFNSQVAQVAFGAITIAGPLEVLDPSNILVDLAVKGISRTASVPFKAATSVVDNISDRISVRVANQAIKDSLGVTDSAGVDAVRSYYDSRLSGKTIDQAIQDLSPSQQIAFTQATMQIGQSLELNTPSERIVAAAILDSVLAPKFVEPELFVQRGSVLADLLQQAQSSGNLSRETFEELALTPGNNGKPLVSMAEVDALAARGVFNTEGQSPILRQIGAYQAAQDVMEADGLLVSIQQAQVESQIARLKEKVAVPVVEREPLIRPKVVEGRVEGIRIGQASDQESEIISRLLEPDPKLRQDSGLLAQTWDSLTSAEKDQVVAQATREIQIKQSLANAQVKIPATPDQAIIQLGQQTKLYKADDPSQLTQSVQAANRVVPQIEAAVTRLAERSELTPSQISALRLAGINPGHLEQVVEGLSDSQRANLVKAILSNPGIITDAEIVPTLTQSGISKEKAQLIQTTFDNVRSKPIENTASRGSQSQALTDITETFNDLKQLTPPSPNRLTVDDLLVSRPTNSNITDLLVPVRQDDALVQLRDTIIDSPGCLITLPSSSLVASTQANILGIELGRCPLERNILENPVLARLIEWGDGSSDGAMTAGIRMTDQILFNSSPTVDRLTAKARQLFDNFISDSRFLSSSKPDLDYEGDYFVYLDQNGKAVLQKPSADSPPILLRLKQDESGDSFISELVLPKSLETNPQALKAVEEFTGRSINPTSLAANDDLLLAQLAERNATNFFPVGTTNQPGLLDQARDQLGAAREWIDQNILGKDSDRPLTVSDSANGNPCPVGWLGNDLTLELSNTDSNVLAARVGCPDPVQRQRASEAIKKVISGFSNNRVVGTPGKGMTADIFRVRGRDYGVRPEYSPRAGIRSTNHIFELTSPNQLKRDGLYNYILTSDGRIIVGDRRAVPNERGIKHIQLAGEVWGVNSQGIPSRPDIGIIRSGEIKIDNQGRILIDLQSGTFSDYGKHIGWEANTDNFGLLEDIIEGNLGVRPLAVGQAEAPSRNHLNAALGRANEVLQFRDQFRVESLNKAVSNAANEINQAKAKIASSVQYSEIIAHARLARQNALDAIDAAQTSAEKNLATQTMKRSIDLNNELAKGLDKRFNLLKKEQADLDKSIKSLQLEIKNNPTGSDVSARLAELELRIEQAKVNASATAQLASDLKDLSDVANYDQTIKDAFSQAERLASDTKSATDQIDSIFAESKKVVDEAASSPPNPNSSPPQDMVDELKQHYEAGKKASSNAYNAAQAGDISGALDAVQEAERLLAAAKKAAGANSSKEVSDLLRGAEINYLAALEQAIKAAQEEHSQIELAAELAKKRSVDGVKKANEAIKEAQSGTIKAAQKQAKEAATMSKEAQSAFQSAESRAAKLETAATKTSNPQIKQAAVEARQAADKAKISANTIADAAKKADQAVTDAFNKLARETQAELDAMATKSFYDILGISPTASQADVRSAYANLAKKYHPDVNPTPQAADAFKKVKEAYDVLNDVTKRRRYDTLGHYVYTGRPAGGSSASGSNNAGSPPGSNRSGAGNNANSSNANPGSGARNSNPTPPPGGPSNAGANPGSGSAGSRTGSGTVEDVLNEMLNQDLYARLGVSRGASPREIASAYRKLAMEFHPDHNSDPHATDVFKLIQEAYDILKKPNTKADYDAGRYRPRGGWAADGVRSRRAGAQANAAGSNNAGSPPGSNRSGAGNNANSSNANPGSNAGQSGANPAGGSNRNPGSAGGGAYTPPGSGFTYSPNNGASQAGINRNRMRNIGTVALGLSIGGVAGGGISITCIIYDLPCFGLFGALNNTSTTPTVTSTATPLIAPTAIVTPTTVVPPTLIPIPPTMVTVPTITVPNGRTGSGDEGVTVVGNTPANAARTGSGDEGQIVSVLPQTTTPIVKPGNQAGQSLVPGELLPSITQPPTGTSTNNTNQPVTPTSPVNSVPTQTTAPSNSIANTPTPISPLQSAGVLTSRPNSPTGIQPIPVVVTPSTLPPVIQAVAQRPVALINDLIMTINQLIAPGVTPDTIPSQPVVTMGNIIYDGPGCWGNHSVIMKIYSNGSDEYTRDYGVVPGECGNPLPQSCGAQPVIQQCGVDIGLEDKDPSHLFEVTPVLSCETLQISYQEVDKGISQQCQNSGFASKDKKSGESCVVNEQCQSGLTCDLYHTKTCVQKLNKIEVFDDSQKECAKVQSTDYTCYKEEGIYKGHRVKIINDKKGDDRCTVTVIDYGPGQCQ